MKIFSIETLEREEKNVARRGKKEFKMGNILSLKFIFFKKIKGRE